jgi:GNAT superfamily N-acetyltransferase
MGEGQDWREESAVTGGRPMNLNEIKEVLVARITFYLEPHLKNLHHYYIEDDGGKIKVVGATDDTTSGLYVLVGIFITEEARRMYISNINLPDFMRHQGIGRKLIKVIYKAATELRYELFISPMTQVFYESMKKRGAMEYEKPYVLKIVDGTILD